MKRVIDVGEAGTDAAVLTDSGSAGLISCGFLTGDELAAHLDDETPVYVLRNKKGADRRPVGRNSGKRTGRKPLRTRAGN